MKKDEKKKFDGNESELSYLQCFSKEMLDAYIAGLYNIMCINTINTWFGFSGPYSNPRNMHN